MLPGGLTFPQLTLAAVVGVAGGLYIYRPLYKQYRLEQAKAQGNPAPGAESGGTNIDDSAPPRAAGGDAGQSSPATGL
ncbi:protein PIGBOS1 [Leucoraja erinacea]|uniref:protein PIGBOS1 n=1 Tax=Leucoraja erinaceus TaxID=7782 RepID=UPI00245481C0|nr:protein PIGBOS1 [Leucoraja erinacea]